MQQIHSKRTRIEMKLRHHWEQFEGDYERFRDFLACLLLHVREDDNELRRSRELMRVVKLFEAMHNLPKQIEQVLTMLENDPNDESFE